MAESTAVADRAPDLAEAPAPPAWHRPLTSPGWIPAVLVAAATAVVMLYYDVPARDVVTFALYSLGCVTLPGVLIWRAVQGRSGWFAFDVALGTTAGFVVELPVYLLARELGAPLAVLIWPIATVVAFAAVPSLRRHWRGGDARLPLGVAWSLALSFLFVLATVSLSVFRWNAVVGPTAAQPNHDFPFQFALVGLLKHDVPLNTPWVTGVPLLYHWYVYAHGAAASWISGAEPQILVLRLLPLTMIAPFLVLLVALVRRLTGRWWPGNVALLLTLLGVAASPFGWGNRPTYNGSIIDNLWISPTQTFAALFFVAACYVLVGLQRDPGEARRVATWVVFAALIGALAGAKATFVPMVICGLLFAAALRWLTTRRRGPELPALGITLVWMAFAQFVLYGGGSQGTVVRPLQTAKWADIGMAVLGYPTPADRYKPLLVLTVLTVLATAFGWAGMAGLLTRRWLTDPTVHVLAGFVAAGVGALHVFAHPGVSQTYFLRSASPYLAVLSAVGLAALIPAAPDRAPQLRRRIAVLFAAAVVLGAAALFTVQHTVGAVRPTPEDAHPLRAVTTAYAALVGLLLAIALGLLLAARRSGLGRRLGAAAAVIAVLTTAVTTGVLGSKNLYLAVTTDAPIRNVPPPKTPVSIPAGAVESMRWLRDNSRPTDIVATNSHCRVVYAKMGCDSRDFWVAAFSERQVVVEGWSYTEPAFASGGLYDRTLWGSAFWKPELLAANDAVFSGPTAESVAAFVTANDVRWLVAVGTATSPDLGRYTTLRYQAGQVRVYEVR